MGRALDRAARVLVPHGGSARLWYPPGSVCGLVMYFVHSITVDGARTLPANVKSMPQHNNSRPACQSEQARACTAHACTRPANEIWRVRVCGYCVAAIQHHSASALAGPWWHAAKRGGHTGTAGAAPASQHNGPGSTIRPRNPEGCQPSCHD